MEPEASSNRTAWIALGAAAAAAFLIAAILLGLGPFADDELTEGEFIARGDAICADAHDDFRKLQPSPPRTASEATELTRELAGIAEDEAGALADLNPPASLEEPADRYLDARERGIALMREGVDAAEEGDAFAYSKAQAELARGQLGRRELAEKAGFTECSRPLFGLEQLERDSKPPLDTDPSAPPQVANPEP